MNTKIQNPRVRFAPSPTGYLHVGGARTALFNWFFAKHYNGKFILRVEDTDTARNKPEFEDEIIKSMKWLGMLHDEGPFRQSERFDRYREFVQQMLSKGKAYKCYCTEADVTQMRATAQAQGKKPMYDRRCRDKNEERPAQPFAIRFKTPLDGEVVVQDLIKGEVRFPISEIDDFVILRTNNTPIYNLTVVVDDVDMKISHVIRAEEHLNNTPKQMLLMEALNFTPPEYAHVPLILASDKTKLSKRHGAVAVSQFKEEGYLPEAMVNGLMRLGWGHGDQEFFTADEFAKFFDLSGCGTSGSVFDKVKLDSINAHYLKQKTPEELVTLIQETYGKDLSPVLATEGGQKLFLALRDRAVRLTDFAGAMDWYLSDTFPISQDLQNQVLATANRPGLASLCENLLALPDSEFVAEKIGPVFKATALSLGLKMPDLAKPSRVLLTGTLASPDIGLVVEVLGKKRVRDRLLKSPG